MGAPLVEFLLSKGHDVVPLSRSSKKDSVFWDPENRLVPIQFLEGFDAVIHLSGEPLSFGRWSKRKRGKIRKSRIETTRFLCETLRSLEKPPSSFICASAVGFYGDRGDEVLDESSLPGAGFLSSVCQGWEEACLPLKETSRVVNARFGVVLGKGGALKQMEPIYKLGLGATLGSGKQWMSWISLEDLISSIDFLLNSQVHGPVNLCSPNPIPQQEFSRALARALHRPHFLKIPSWFLRALFGTAAEEMMLASQRVIPSALIHSDFTFKFKRAEDILQQNY